MQCFISCAVYNHDTMIHKYQIHTILIATILLTSTRLAYGKDYKDEFLKYFHQKDDTKQLEVLTQWEKKAPKDVELFIAYFNYYINKSMGEVMVETNEKPVVGKDTQKLK